MSCKILPPPLAMLDRAILNPTLKLDELRARYERERCVVIEDALEHSFAEDVATSISQCHSEFLLRVRNGTYPRTLTLDKPLSIKKQSVLNSQLAVARHEGLFTYIYYLWELHKGCTDHAACILGQYLGSPECWASIRSITGVEVASSDVVGVTRFQHGHYLAPHSDRIAKFGPFRRRVAFCLYFCRNWKAAHGGLLIQQPDRGARRQVVPGFNQLVLFDLGEGGIAKHSVTEVSHKTATRITMPGFFCLPSDAPGWFERSDAQTPVCEQA